MKRLLFKLLIAAWARPAYAEPVSLRLDKQASRVDFSFRSQIVNTDGQLNDYAGTLRYDPKSLSSSRLELVADPSRVSFGNLPMDQMFLINGLIKSMSTSRVTFSSESFERSGEAIVIHGVTTAGRNIEKVSLPVTIKQLPSQSEVTGIYVRSGLIGSSKNPTSMLFGNSTCRAKFEFIFKQ